MYAYSNTVRVTFIEKGQRQTINVNAENLEAFKALHQDYKFISEIPVRYFFPLNRSEGEDASLSVFVRSSLPLRFLSGQWLAA